MSDLTVTGRPTLVVTAPGRLVVTRPAPAALTVAPGGMTVAVPGPREVVAVGPQGPEGVPGPAGAAVGYTAENRDAAAVPAGGAVAVSPGAAGVVRASAADGSRAAVGLASAATAPGFGVPVHTGGPLTLADWTGATGAASLSPGSPYFVSASTPGRLTAAPPTTAGQVVQCVGAALTADTLLVEIEAPILL